MKWPHRFFFAVVLRLRSVLIRASRVRPSTPPLSHRVERHFFDGQFSRTAFPDTVILERELASTIKEWLKRVSLVPSLTSIPLSDADRTCYLPKLFADLLCRLRLARGDEPPRELLRNSGTIDIAAAAHGRARFVQGYSVAMLVEESRIFEVSTFGTLRLHWRELDQNQVLSDVMIIADEADRQLTEAVRSFLTAQAAAA
jgi:hypothetical protein